MQNSPVLIHVPHASTFIPPNEKRFFLKDDLTDELLKMTDLYTDELFDCGRDMLVFPVSRLVCDVERFRDDTDDPCPNRAWDLPTPDAPTERLCAAFRLRSAQPLRECITISTTKHLLTL